MLTWSRDSFAYADSLEEVAGRYRGLRCGEMVNISQDNLSGLVVRPEVALSQREAERDIRKPADETGEKPPPPPPPPIEPARPKRFHGSVNLDSARVGRDASQIADEVIAHLAGLVGSIVTVTLEIEAKVEAGMPENVVRTVTENSRTLKFTTHGFEED